MSYQIANTEKPNSKCNTTVFSLFEAKDYRSNLKIGLSRFKDQINRLQSTKWQYVYFYQIFVSHHHLELKILQLAATIRFLLCMGFPFFFTVVISLHV